MTPRMRSLIFALAILVVLAITISLSVQPSSASSHSFGSQFSEGIVFQVTTTNSTSTAPNRPGFLDSLTAPIVAYVKAALTPYIGEPPRRPLSTLFTIGVAVVISLVSATTGKVLVDYEMVKNSMKEVQAWRKEMDRAKKANDEQTLSKLMKKNQGMVKLQSRASMEQMKVTAVTFVPFLLLWYLLSAVLGSVVVATAPFQLPFLGTNLVFWQWYFLSNFAISLPTYKLFGIGLSDN